MAENNPESTPKIFITDASGRMKKEHSVIPLKQRRSFKKRIAYGAAAVGTAATMIAGGIAIEKTGKFPLGEGSKSPAALAVARDVPPSETIAPVVVAPTSTPTPISERAARKTAIAAAETRAVEAEEKAADDAAIRAAEERIKKAQEVPKQSTPTEIPTDQQKKDAKVAENLGKEMARLQFEYDKAHPTPVIPIATPASSGKPRQGSEGEGAPPPLVGFLFGSAITAAILGVAYRFRAQGGRLITAIRNRLGGAGGAGGGGATGTT